MKTGLKEILERIPLQKNLSKASQNLLYIWIAISQIVWSTCEKKGEKLWTKSNKHEIWHSSSLGDKKWFKPQTQQKPPFLCILLTIIGFHGNKKKFLQNVHCYISLESIFKMEQKTCQNIYLKWTGNMLHAF